MSWKAGDKAVCIDDAGQGNSSVVINKDNVKEGTIYLVRECRHIADQEALLLEGVFGGYWKSGLEVGFCSYRFRKIVPQCDRAEHSKSANRIL